jgi:hypothetical protein
MDIISDISSDYAEVALDLRNALGGDRGSIFDIVEVEIRKVKNAITVEIGRKVRERHGQLGQLEHECPRCAPLERPCWPQNLVNTLCRTVKMPPDMPPPAFAFGPRLHSLPVLPPSAEPRISVVKFVE